MSSASRIILLDRDGVLNRVIVDPEMGTINSPLHPDQVEVFSWVPEGLARLTKLGYRLSIVTNQPAAAKGLTTRANLDAVHARILREVQSQGGVISSSHICFHRSEEGCDCRKPKPGLLKEALMGAGSVDLAASWMVGDGVTDMEAGVAVGVKTAFLGPRKCDACKIYEERGLKPDFWGKNLIDFVENALK